MNLKEYYFHNIQNSEYHYRFFDDIRNVDNGENAFDGLKGKFDNKFDVYDTNEAITEFKRLCQPEKSCFSNVDRCRFYLITYFLYKYGYEIKEFPYLLARPPVDPYDFTYKDIRNRIIELGDDDSGVVRFATRRQFVNDLTFRLREEDDEYVSDFLESSQYVHASNNVCGKSKSDVNSSIVNEKNNRMKIILIITALEKEILPVIDILNDLHVPRIEEKTISGRKHYTYRLSNNCNVICTNISNVGQTNAAIAVKDVMSHYPISKVIMTGICGGIDKNLKYGDIIISQQVVDYESAKIVGGDIEPRWNVYRGDYELIKRMRSYNSSDWKLSLKNQFPELQYNKTFPMNGTI